MKTSQIFCGVFFAERSPNPVTVSELPKKSGSKARQVLSTNTTQFNKTAAVATAVSSGTQRQHCGTGVPGYIYGSSITARAIPILPGTLLPS